MSEQIDNRIKDANKKAVERIQSSGPVLVDIKPAILHVKNKKAKRYGTRERIICPNKDTRYLSIGTSRFNDAS